MALGPNVFILARLGAQRDPLWSVGLIVTRVGVHLMLVVVSVVPRPEWVLLAVLERLEGA